MDSIPYSEARAHFAETLRRLEALDEAVYISRRGEPAGVLMSVARFRRLQGVGDGPAAQLLAWRARHASGVDEATASGAWTDPFADVRDRSPTRRINWPDDPQISEAS